VHPAVPSPPAAGASVPGLPGDVLSGEIDPGRAFDLETDPYGRADTHTAMTGGRAIECRSRMGPI